MSPLKRFFEHVIVISLVRRPDRRAHFAEEMKAIDLPYEVFDGIDAGPDDGNRGCTASHRAVMGMIARNGWKRCLVFEDDATVRDQFRASFNDEVAMPLREIPTDFDVVYLGGGYGDDPQGWHSKHLIRINAMKTTSSYGVSLKAARALYEYIPADTCDGIDNFFSGWTPAHQCFITEPRFFYQYDNYSDLQKRKMSNQDSMENPDHVTALGKYHAP